MDTTGFRISYVLPGFVVVPDQIRITQIVDVHGTNFDNSWIENTISVTNLGDSFTEIGIRLLTD
ncbi:MAG: hypothetical protein GWO23_24710, partial [Gammaproteobacteria bacterium]|nr:hypothetical protein [Gammaproteobacteria bacterium]